MWSSRKHNGHLLPVPNVEATERYVETNIEFASNGNLHNIENKI